MYIVFNFRYKGKCRGDVTNSLEVYYKFSFIYLTNSMSGNTKQFYLNKGFQKK